jgi:hypothetical protein
MATVVKSDATVREIALQAALTLNRAEAYAVLWCIVRGEILVQGPPCRI